MDEEEEDSNNIIDDYFPHSLPKYICVNYYISFRYVFPVLFYLEKKVRRGKAHTQKKKKIDERKKVRT
jgi:hypothetical protein